MQRVSKIKVLCQFCILKYWECLHFCSYQVLMEISQETMIFHIFLRNFSELDNDIVEILDYSGIFWISEKREIMRFSTVLFKRSLSILICRNWYDHVKIKYQISESFYAMNSEFRSSQACDLPLKQLWNKIKWK